MLISADTRISFPRSLVYATYRDKLVELIPYMPNIRQIEVKSHREEDRRVYSINEWHGGGEIPFAARAILSEDMLSWTEYNTWNEAEFSVEWRIKTHVYTEAVHCAGKNYFLADGDDSTIIKSRGELMIDSKQITGVPWFIASKVAEIVQDFLGKKIEPNLLQMSEGVRQYLARQAKG